MSWCFCTSWRKGSVSQAMPPTSPHWQACQPASFREELRLIHTLTERPRQSDVLGLSRMLMCAGRCHIFIGQGWPSNMLTKHLQMSEPTGLSNSVCTEQRWNEPVNYCSMWRGANCLWLTGARLWWKSSWASTWRTKTWTCSTSWKRSSCHLLVNCWATPERLLYSFCLFYGQFSFLLSSSDS